MGHRANFQVHSSHGILGGIHSHGQACVSMLVFFHLSMRSYFSAMCAKL